MWGLLLCSRKGASVLTLIASNKHFRFCRILEAGFYGTSKTPVFAEREMPPGLQAEIWKHIVEEGVFNPNLLYHEVDWFCGLGLQRYYFRRFTPKILSRHVHSYIAARKLATANGDPEQIWFHIENNPDFLGGSGPEQVFIMCSNTDHKQAYAESKNDE